MGLSLSLLLLTGCAGPGGAGPGAEPAVSSPQPAVSVSEEEGPEELILVDDPDSPYPMIESTLSADLDGDGAADTVSIRRDKRYWENELGQWHEGRGLNPATLLVETAGRSWELPLERDPDSYAWWERPAYLAVTPMMMADTQGNPVVAVALEIPANHYDIYTLRAFRLEAGQLKQLPVPCMEEPALGVGFPAELTYQDNRQIRVSAPDSGLAVLRPYDEEDDPNRWLSGEFQSLYDEKGVFLYPDTPRAGEADQAVELAADQLEGRPVLRSCQPLTPLNCGLYTWFTWDKDQIIVLEQRVQP